MQKTDMRRIAVIAVLIAAEIILSRFLSIPTPITKIGFAFLPVALAGMLYGPIYAGVAGGIADFLGAMLFPIGPFFPGFTLTAALKGAAYGLLLHKHEKSMLRICCAVLIVCLGLSLALDTYWLYIITGRGYLALFPPRILQNVIMIPLQVAVIRLFASERIFSLIAGTSNTSTASTK